MTTDRRLSNRDNVFIRRQFLFNPPVKIFVLEVNHGIGIAHCCFQQSFRIVRSCRAYDFQSRRVDKMHFRVLRMKGSAVDTAAARRADDKRDAGIPPVTAFRCEIRDLIESA